MDQALGATITIKNFNNSPAAKTYQFVRNIAGAAATGSITVPNVGTLVPTAETVGASFRIYDEDGTTFDDYQFVRNRAGASATGSINFDGAVSSSIEGDTITLKNWNASSTKTYEFVNNITAKAATGSITVPSPTVLVPLANDLGATFTIKDEPMTTSKTYQFVRSTFGATATGSVNFDSATKTGIDGNTITIQNWNDANTKTYEFVNNVTGTPCSGSLIFGANTNAEALDQGTVFIRNAAEDAKTFKFVKDKSASPASIEFSLDYMPGQTTNSSVTRYYGNGGAQNVNKVAGHQPQAIIHVRAHSGSDDAGKMRKFLFTVDDISTKPDPAYIDFTHLYNHNGTSMTSTFFGSQTFNYSASLNEQQFTISDVEYHPGITHMMREIGTTSSNGQDVITEEDVMTHKHLYVYPSPSDPYRNPDPAQRQFSRTYRFLNGENQNYDYLSNFLSSGQIIINISGTNAYKTPLRIAKALRDAINKRQSLEFATPRLTASIESERSFARFSFAHITSNPDSPSGWDGTSAIPNTCGTHASELDGFKMTFVIPHHKGELHPEDLSDHSARRTRPNAATRAVHFTTNTYADSGFEKVPISSSLV